jgi:hypothetical protein
MTSPKSSGWDADRHSAIRQMEFVVEGLNGPKIKTRRANIAKARYKRHCLPESALEMETELRRLVEEWRRSGPNVIKLFEQEPELAAFSKRGQIAFYPTDAGRGHLVWSPSDVLQGISPPKDVARDRFMMLITSPDWETLSGPCLGCGDYFRKKVDRPRVYCSARCGSKVSAVKATETTRERDHLEKIKIAQTFVEEWKEKPRRDDWKAWIAAKGLIKRNVKFTEHWLTRAVNRGDLKPPVP